MPGSALALERRLDRPPQLPLAPAGDQLGLSWGGARARTPGRPGPPSGLRPLGDRGVASSRVGGPGLQRMRTGAEL